MNRILNINLGGYPTTIDDDAYEYLKAYLDNIQRRFTESDGRDEIMRDVETRLGELVNQYKGNNTIVMLPHVESAIEIMGKPEDFGGEPGPTTAQQAGTAAPSGKATGSAIKTGRKLYRDSEDMVVGGVCSGLSAYFGLPDPLWMRIIFVILSFVTFGFVVAAYVFLYLVVPIAGTSSERLEMKGEPINVNNIAKEFEEGYERLSNRINGDSGNGFRRVSSTAFSGCLMVLSKLGLGLLILIAVSMIGGLGTAWITGIFAFLTAEPYIDYFSPLSKFWTYIAAFSGFLVLGLPVVSLCLWLGNTIFKFKTPSWLKTTMGTVWTVGFIALFGIASYAGRSLRAGGTVNKPVDLSALTSDTLKVSWAEPSVEHDDDWVRWEWPWSDGRAFMNGDKLELTEFVRIRVRKSKSGVFECRQDIRARGANSSDATAHAAAIEYTAFLEGNQLKVPNKIELKKDAKWWVRTITLYISVPEGKSIVFDNQIYSYAAAEFEEYAPEIDDNYISKSPNMVYKMTKDGLTCASCPSMGDSNYHSDTNYEKFIFEGDIEVEIREGDDFSMKIEGDRSVLETIKKGEKLTITTNGNAPSSKTKITIFTPRLSSLFADNTGLITIRGFDENEVQISGKGKSKIKAYLDVDHALDVSLSDQSALELTGKGGHLNAKLSDNADIDASDWRAGAVEVFATGNSRGRLFASDRATVKSSAPADIQIEGTDNIEKK